MTEDAQNTQQLEERIADLERIAFYLVMTDAIEDSDTDPRVEGALERIYLRLSGDDLEQI